jgi:hypothetical protein
MFPRFEGLADATTTYRVEGTGLDFRTAALYLAGVSGDLGLRGPKQSDTLNPRTAKDRVREAVTSPSYFS